MRHVKVVVLDFRSLAHSKGQSCADTLMLWFLISSQLLNSPRFHQGVHSIHKRIHQLRYGQPPEELGGTNIDKKDSLFEHFVDEIQKQVKGGPPKR